MKIPVIKGRIGSWIYYVGTMTFDQIASNQINTSELLQRHLSDNYNSIKTIC
jgi:hypothetical protein